MAYSNPVPVTRDVAIAWMPLAIAVATLFVVIGVALTIAEHSPNPPGTVYGRTIRTADATMVLLIIALPLYFLSYRARCYGGWWLAFWTAALVAFVVHLSCAIFGTFGGSFFEIFRHNELVTHPVFDLLLFAWWAIDVWLAWSAAPDPAIRAQRGLLHVVLPLAFFMATREAKLISVTGQWLGALLLGCTGAAALFWATIRRPVPKPPN